MALLPRVQRRGTLTQAPRSTVSAGTIASPYQSVAQAFGEVSQTLSEKVTDDFQIRGQNAVVIGEDGLPRVEFLPNTSPWARAYNRAASQAYLARLSNNIRDRAQAISIEANGNVDFFNAAWQTFSGEVSATAPEMVRGGVDAMLAEVGGGQSRGIVASRFDADTREFEQTLTAERQRIAAQLSSLAYSGGIGTPEFDSLVAQYTDLGQELVDNPAFGVSAEAQQWADDRFDAKLVILGVRGDVARRFATSPNEARAYAESIINDPDLPLTATERLEAIGAVMSQFTASSSAYRVGLAAYDDASADTLKFLEDPELPVNWADVGRVLAEGERLGAFDRVAEIRRAASDRAFLDGLDFTQGGGGLDTYNRQMDWATGSSQAFLTERFAGSNVTINGVNPDFGSRLARAINDAEAATGARATITSAFRTTAQQQQLYQAYLAGDIGLAAPPGRSRHEIGAAADIAAGPVLDWLHANAANYGLAFLTGDAFAVDPGHIQLAGEGSPVGFPITPELLTDERQAIGTELDLLLDQATQLNSSGYGFDEEFGSTLIDYALAVDDPAVSQRVADVITEASASGLVNGLSPGQTEALIAQLSGTQGGDAYVASLMLDAAEDRRAELDRLRRENPAALFGAHQLGTLTPVITTGEDGRSSVDENALQLRETQLAQVSDLYDGEVFPLFQPEEVANLARTFNQAAPDEQLAMLGAINGAIRDDDVRIATLGQLAEGEGRMMANTAVLQGNNPAAAEGVLRGMALVAEEPRWAPDDNSTAGFTVLADEAIPPNLFGGAGAFEGARQDMIEMVKFRYVSLAAAAGQRPGTDGIDQTLLDRAVAEITGGTVNFNGQDIIAPVYGMDQAAFNSMINMNFNVTPTSYANQARELREQGYSPAEAAAAVQEMRGGQQTSPAMDIAMRGAATALGEPILWSDVLGHSDVHLENAADGVYYIRFGEGELATYAIDARTGGHFRLNLKLASLYPQMRAADQRRLEAVGPDPSPALPPPLPAPAPPAPTEPAPTRQPQYSPGASETNEAYQRRMIPFIQTIGEERARRLAETEGPAFGLAVEAAFSEAAPAGPTGADGQPIPDLSNYTPPPQDEIEDVIEGRTVPDAPDRESPDYHAALATLREQPIGDTIDTITRENFYALQVALGFSRVGLINWLVSEHGWDQLEIARHLNSLR